MNLNKPEQLRASDITYIKSKNGSMYLSLITDAYSKKIIGYEVSDNLKAESSKKALKMAIKNRNYPKRKLINHSDRGIQYCCPEYTDVLDEYKIKISITQQYDPYENSIAERINGILKQEFDISDNRPVPVHSRIDPIDLYPAGSFPHLGNTPILQLTSS
jgi:transposase InsO family protein